MTNLRITCAVCDYARASSTSDMRQAYLSGEQHCGVVLIDKADWRMFLTAQLLEVMGDLAQLEGEPTEMVRVSLDTTPMRRGEEAKITINKL